MTTRGCSAILMGGEMYFLKRTTVALAAVATLGVGTARADLVLVGTVTVGGTGLGTVNTVLTLTELRQQHDRTGMRGTERGRRLYRVNRSGCLRGRRNDRRSDRAHRKRKRERSPKRASPPAPTSPSCSTPSNQPGTPSRCNTLSANFYNNAGTLLYTATYTGGPHNFLTTQTGTGNTVEMFTLDATQAAIVQGLITANTAAGVRVGLGNLGWKSAPAQGGPETYFIFNNGAATVTPEPSTVVLMATGLVGLVGFVRRRRA
jgi:hypothetical protein